MAPQGRSLAFRSVLSLLAIAGAVMCCSAAREPADGKNAGESHARSHRLKLGEGSRNKRALGFAAALIRYHSDENLEDEVERSLARAKGLVRMTREANDREAEGLRTDLSNGAPFEYLMKISLGTPPQTFLAVADTGSDLVWLRCKSCDGCVAQKYQIFDPERSETYSQLACNSKPCQHFAMLYGGWAPECISHCRYSYFYADNSNTTGDLSVETLHMKATSGEAVGVHKFAFGCGLQESSGSTLYANADGIIGLGKGPLSFPFQLGVKFGRRFSYCLVDRKQAKVQSSPLLFGDAALPTVPGVQYTPFLENSNYPTYYYLGLEKITVGGKVLRIPRSAFSLKPNGDGGTVIDSGTTYTQLVSPAYGALVEELAHKIPYQRVMGYFDLCYDVTRIPDLVVPSISLHFHGGARYNLPFGNAFITVKDDPVPGRTTMCLAMNNSTYVDFSIIGNYQQSNFIILYDQQDKRLGFVPYQCSDV